jgi:hypothetical protein
MLKTTTCTGILAYAALHLVLLLAERFMVSLCRMPSSSLGSDVICIKYLPFLPEIVGSKRFV